MRGGWDQIPIIKDADEESRKSKADQTGSSSENRGKNRGSKDRPGIVRAARDGPVAGRGLSISSSTAPRASPFTHRVTTTEYVDMYL